MNLLFVIHYPVFGGPHNRALRLAPVLAQRGVATTVLLPDTPGNAAERLSAAGVDVVALPLHRVRASVDPLKHAWFAARFWPEVQSIRREIRERDIGVVQIGGLVNPHAAVAARMENVPIVWQVLDTRPPTIVRRVMMPLVARMADSVMFAGEALIDAHPGAAALSKRNFVFYPPVDTGSFSPDCADPASVRRELGIPAEAPVIGTVANLNPQKGHEYFVRAAALIRQQRPDARFIVVGAFYDTHRAYADGIRRLAHELALSDAIVLTGHRDDAQRMLRAMDVSVLASVPRSEGAPTAAQESLAVGTPVVATDVGASAEVIDEGVTGHIVPPLDAQAIAEAALRVLADPTMRERMSRAGRQAAQERFSLERCAQSHIEAYDGALRIRGRSPLPQHTDRASLSGAGSSPPGSDS